tara:strand:- start:238 stop:480 length:243 start_codon:yes stop_codon:yes gene_type:complete
MGGVGSEKSEARGKSVEGEARVRVEMRVALERGLEVSGACTHVDRQLDISLARVPQHIAIAHEPAPPRSTLHDTRGRTFS